MEVSNTTLPSEFILLGFYEWPYLHLSLFVIFLLFYLMALIGNLIIIVVIIFSPNLHTPMYFFWGNLATVDILLTSTIMPKILDIFLRANHSITYLGCFTQVLFFAICGVVENFLLAVMAYDRCVAICFPLRYSHLVNLRISIQLALSSWGFGVLESVLMTGLISHCSFTDSHIINHLFCDFESLLKLSTSVVQVAQMALLVSGLIFGFIPMVFILMTYAFIIYNILRIRSREGKRKAFMTCSSHIIVITIFLVIILRIYVRPKSGNSIEQDKIQSVLYTCLIPTLNPIIYSLRNKDVHRAIRKLKLNIHGT